MRYTLIDGQGNFGSQDGDPPAAMRYTEVRMHRVAEAMMEDIDKDTIDFQMNFDDSLNEPTVLPTRVPQLLVNGSSGIAVGMATNIPPYNLAELADATGGSFFHNNNDLGEGLKRIAAQPEFIYVLGFSPQNLKLDGSFHALKVSLTKQSGAGLQLQSRRGYFVARHAIDPVEQAKQEVEEAFFSRDEIRDLKRAMGQAIAAGYRDARTAATDHDLDVLRAGGMPTLFDGVYALDPGNVVARVQLRPWPPTRIGTARSARRAGRTQRAVGRYQGAGVHRHRLTASSGVRTRQDRR